jgi:hypothetical protein
MKRPAWREKHRKWKCSLNVGKVAPIPSIQFQLADYR